MVVVVVVGLVGVAGVVLSWAIDVLAASLWGKERVV